jgi:hypothetical protein
MIKKLFYLHFRRKIKSKTGKDIKNRTKMIKLEQKLRIQFDLVKMN